MKADLAQRIGAGSAVITPNRRLAAHVKRDFDFAQLASGKAAWPSADCLPLAAFFERTYAELTRLSPGTTQLNPQQEAALWEQVLQDSPYGSTLLNPTAAARAAREAWEIEHAYRIELVKYRSVLDEDGQAYLAWAARLRDLMRANRWLDAARLPDALVEVMEKGAGLEPRALVLYGFDQLTPQSRTVLDALAARGWEAAEIVPPSRAGNAERTAYDDREVELVAVAEEVRAALSVNPAQRIGVIVPDFAAARGDIIRIFDDVLDPPRILAGTRERARPYNVSLGPLLADYPLVHTAFLILKLAHGELALEDAGSLLRSPFIAGAEQELAARALLDAKLRRDGRPLVELRALARRSRGENARDPAGSPQLAARLASWTRLAGDARRARQSPSQWSLTFQGLLAGFGWPGERALDSEDYQTFRKWREIVSSLSALDIVTPRLGYDEALARLRRFVADATFQPESPEVPVQVLGVLEANGIEFDRLFVTGLTDETWPPPPRPNPFLPLALQRAREVPRACAEWQLEYARRTMKLWLGAAPEVRLSWPRREGDRELSASFLLRDIRQAPRAARTVSLLREVIHAARVSEELADFSAPALPAGIGVTGGATFFQNQAACPFRAFAVHRLGARALEAASVGLDARDRGGLIHLAAFNLWRELKTHEALCKASGERLQSAIKLAVASAVESTRRKRPDVMTEAFAALERERVADLLGRLLELEKQRAPFMVLVREDPRAVSVAGVQVSTRLDRLDRLADGSEVILDYKTSREVDAADWLGERPDEPQLPLYAAGGGEELAAVAFAQLHARQVRFEGLSRRAAVLPGVPALADSKKASSYYGSWGELLEGWRAVLENLAREYLAGRAEVAPKDYPRTCEYCELGALCRVKELKDRGPVAAGGNSDD